MLTKSNLQDDEEELMKELERIKKERAEEAAKKVRSTSPCMVCTDLHLV